MRKFFQSHIGTVAGFCFAAALVIQMMYFPYN
jgi:hypothetical protein